MHNNDNDDALKGDTVIGTIAGDEAREATEHEHSLGLVEALKLYPTAVGWSVFFSLGIIMTAFDPQLLGELIFFFSFSLRRRVVGGRMFEMRSTDE